MAYVVMAYVVMPYVVMAVPEQLMRYMALGEDGEYRSLSALELSQSIVIGTLVIPIDRYRHFSYLNRSLLGILVISIDRHRHFSYLNRSLLGILVIPIDRHRHFDYLCPIRYVARAMLNKLITFGSFA